MFGGKILSENTLKLYEANLKRLNNGVLPTSPVFLKNTEAVIKKIEKYSLNTKKSYFITVVSYLKDKKLPKKIIKFYTDKMDELNKTFEDHKGEKTETQEKNWITWKEVMEHYDKLNPASLEHLLLSLFVLQPPRRSKDYFLMKIVPEFTDTMDKEFNYLSWKDMRMHFNNYKQKPHTEVSPWMSRLNYKRFCINIFHSKRSLIHSFYYRRTANAYLKTVLQEY
jgi:hypothetical protein